MRGGALSLSRSNNAGGSSRPEAIAEVSEPATPIGIHDPASPGVSALTELIRNSPPETPSTRSLQDTYSPYQQSTSAAEGDVPFLTIEDPSTRAHADEQTPLLPKDTVSFQLTADENTNDVEGQSECPDSYGQVVRRAMAKGAACARTLMRPKSWDRKAIWRNCFLEPASLLPAVFLGLLLNVLDALSYGMILFPLGQPLFADLGSDGISIFYVSTIISQLVFSCGGSIFKGGIGSEMIEVVPFFHKMAFTILNRVGEGNPKAVIATTVLSYAISSILTGTVFFLMGAFRIGSLMSFFPRNILIGQYNC